MKPWKQTDVVIVGGGPAGATAAFLLARKGFEVDLFEKKKVPRHKLCAGLITWKTVTLIGSLLDEPISRLKTMGIFTHACRDYRVFFKQSEIGRGSLDFPFHFVRRAEYDHWWLKAARRAGARIHDNEAVLNLDPENRRIVTSDGRHIQARVVIGADGVWSLTRKTCHGMSHLKQWRRGLAMALEIRTPFNRSTPPPNHAALHFGYVPWGYAWSFPSQEEWIIGVCSLRRLDDRPFKASFYDFLNELEPSGQLLVSLQSHPLPYGNFLRRPSRNHVLLVGDACGLADPLLGEGIYYAHRSAQLAAQAICADTPDFQRLDNLYTHLIHRRLTSELRWVQAYRNLLFYGGRVRRFRGLKLFLHMFPKRLEAAIQGKRPFSRLLWPG